MYSSPHSHDKYQRIGCGEESFEFRESGEDEDVSSMLANTHSLGAWTTPHLPWQPGFNHWVVSLIRQNKTARCFATPEPLWTGATGDLTPPEEVVSLIRQNKTARCFATPEPLWTGATDNLTPPEEVFRKFFSHNPQVLPGRFIWSGAEFLLQLCKRHRKAEGPDACSPVARQGSRGVVAEIVLEQFVVGLPDRTSAAGQNLGVGSLPPPCVAGDKLAVHPRGQGGSEPGLDTSLLQPLGPSEA
ncbi:hypothetical protein EYF80_045664 [Liparis tanakae]|uniref:Uncharacterized protein n=1 Tax=Liparis tanakae TaxID=230148 RepID=A0A4Z2FTG2_9TELE|nr:hypothetical protein EYF80_045664 [Liparis tanakae]